MPIIVNIYTSSTTPFATVARLWQKDKRLLIELCSYEQHINTQQREKGHHGNTKTKARFSEQAARHPVKAVTEHR